MAETILTQIKSAYSQIFRRVWVKRRSASTGLFESQWQNISKEVKNWGTIRREIDKVRYSKIRFSDVMMKFENSAGKYNPNDDEASMWYQYGSQQRSLIKIEAGFIHQTQSSSGIWTNTEYPASSAIFHGIISGDISLSDDNHVQIPVRPLLQIFREYPARNLTGWNSSGMTASQFMTMLRDQTDGSGSYVFRPFFQDTTTFWDITTTVNNYAFLSTSTAISVYNQTVWDIMEKLADAEDKVIYVKNNGTFVFGDRDEHTTTAQFFFYGAGFPDTQYGHTIKKVTKFGKKQTDFYSRVEVKWIDSNTFTSVRVRETAFTVTGNNDAWNLGHRTYKFENLWINTITVADTIADNIYNVVTNVKDQIEFTATLVPHLEILDKVTMNYDASAQDQNSRWDAFDWTADNTSTSTDLYWDRTSGDAIRLVNAEFKILSIDLNLDNLETKITGTRL